MELLDVTKRPVITEESMSTIDGGRCIFEVDTRANKTLVKQTAESAFDVKVANVDILNVYPKFKRMGRYADYTKERRKMIATLTEDSKEVQLFEAAG